MENHRAKLPGTTHEMIAASLYDQFLEKLWEATWRLSERSFPYYLYTCVSMTRALNSAAYDLAIDACLATGSTCCWLEDTQVLEMC